MKIHAISKWWISLLFTCLALTSEAKIKLPPLIANGMVLQREQPIKLWGNADSGETVKIKFHKAKYETKADAKGYWEVTLKPMKAGGPYTMTINEQTINNILIGDVFLCSGQSNMELMVSRVTDKYASEISSYENSNIRYIKIPYAYNFNQPETNIKPAEWKALSQKNVMGYSALCYFFSKLMYEKTKVPVGIINASGEEHR